MDLFQRTRVTRHAPSPPQNTLHRHLWRSPDTGLNPLSQRKWFPRKCPRISQADSDGSGRLVFAELEGCVRSRLGLSESAVSRADLASLWTHVDADASPSRRVSRPPHSRARVFFPYSALAFPMRKEPFTRTQLGRVLGARVPAGLLSPRAAAVARLWARRTRRKNARVLSHNTRHALSLL